MQRVNEVIHTARRHEDRRPDRVGTMNRMGVPQPDCTPDGVLAEIARVVPFFKSATWEGLI